MVDSEVEVLDAGPAGRGRLRRPLQVGILALLVCVVIAVVVWPGPLAGTNGVDPAPPSAPASESARAPAATPSLIGQPPAVLHLLAPRIAGFGSGSLVVRSTELVYRIRLSDGRTVATPLGLDDDGVQARLLAGRDATVLRSSDDATVLIPNDRASTLQAGAMSHASQVLPGAAGTFWVRSAVREDAVVMTRVRADGTETDQHVSSLGTYLADGRGDLLLLDSGGIWSLRRDAQRVTRWQRLTAGELTATGRNYLLFTECDSFSRCGLIRYDRATGRRTPVSRLTERLAAGGSVSADGRYVTELAMSSASTEGGAVPVVLVIDLGSGRTVASIVVTDRVADLSNVAVWSRTGHRLLAISNGDLVTLDPPTGTVRPVGLRLGALRQLSLPPD